MVERETGIGSKSYGNLKGKLQELPGKVGSIVAFTSAEGLLSIKSGIFTKTPAQGRIIRETSLGVRENRQINPAELVERGFLGDFELNMEGLKNIPLGKPLLIVSNHDNKGVLSSIGQICAVSYAIELARQGEGNSLREDRDTALTSPHWVIASESDSWSARNIPVVKKYSREINEAIARSSRGILVDRNGQTEHKASVYTMLGIWRKKGVVAMHPEGKDHHRLRVIDPRAVELIRFTQRLPDKIRPAIVPVAGWTDKNRRTVFIKAGPSVYLSENLSDKDRIMVALARLLPPGKRGAYALKT